MGHPRQPACRLASHRGRSQDGGPADPPPPAQQDARKARQGMDHNVSRIKQASTRTNSITNTAFDSGGPPPQGQGGPGWGILYKPQIPTEATSSGGATSSSDPGHATPAPGTKASTYAHEQARAKFAGLLNKHLEPRHPRTATQQTQPPPATTPPRQTPQHRPQHNNQADTAPALSQTTAEAAQAEWASTQPGHFEGELPPPIFFSTATGSSQEYRPLTHGCWELRIGGEANPEPTATTAAAGLPPLRTVRVGQSGPLESAPPFPSGMIGRVAPMPQPGQWLLIVTYVPELDTCEPHSLLVAEGDQFMAQQTDRGWRLAVEKLAHSTAREQHQNQAATAPPSHTDNNPTEPATAAATPTGGEDDEDSEGANDDDSQDGRPPRLPLSEQAEPQMTQLGDGKWQIEVVRDKSSRRPATQSGLPKTVIEGDGGPVSRAPALPIGTVGTFEILTPEMWLFDIEEAPDHSSYEADTMLLVPGDRLLLEYQDGSWHMRIEHLAPDAPGPVMRLRQRRRNLLAAERRARLQTTNQHFCKSDAKRSPIQIVVVLQIRTSIQKGTLTIHYTGPVFCAARFDVTRGAS